MAHQHHLSPMTTMIGHLHVPDLSHFVQATYLIQNVGSTVHCGWTLARHLMDKIMTLSKVLLKIVQPEIG